MIGYVRGAAQALASGVLLAALVPAVVGAQDVTIADCARPGASCPAPSPDQHAGTPDQLPPTARPAARLEVSILGGVFGGDQLGETAAHVLTNEVPSGGSTALFKTQSSITTAPVVEGRLGVRVVGSLWVEGGVSYARPEFVVDISGDVEGAPDAIASSGLTQLTLDGGLQYRWQGRRISPFVMGGAGYLRQLDDPRTTVENGSLFYGGGGAIVRLTTAPSGWLSHLALRADARVAWLRGGVMFVDQRGPALVVSGGLVLSFQ